MKHVLSFILGVVVTCGGAYIFHHTTIKPKIVSTLETNSEIMDEVILTNARLIALQDDLWRVGHYVNPNHEGSPVCPECKNAIDVDINKEVQLAKDLPAETFPDNLDTIQQNAVDIKSMITSIRTKVGSAEITNDFILKNLRSANVETE